MADISFDDLIPKANGSRKPSDISFTDLLPKREQLRAEDRRSVEQSKPEYIEVPSYDPMGNYIGTERTLKPSKADPVGRGALTMLPFGEDIGAWSRSLESGRTQAQEKMMMQGEREAAQESYPKAFRLGQAAAIVPQLYVPSAMGMASSTLGRMGIGATEGAAWGGVTGLGEGISMEERLQNAKHGALFGGGFGAAIPGAIGAIGAVSRPVYERVIRPNIIEPIQGMISSKSAAERKLSRAIEQGEELSQPAFEQMLKKNEPVVIGDVSTGARSLARSSANVSPDARAALEETVGPRFAGQSERVKETVSGFFPGSTDYATVVGALKQRARAENKPAYDRARAQGAENVMSNKLWSLSQTSPTVRQAIKEAESLGADIAAAEGRAAPVNPFTFDSKGYPVFKENATAKDASLDFWDAVKQNLDDQVDALYRAGSNKKAGAVKDIRDQLRDELDRIVPSYEMARGTAAKHFKVSDAFEAGIMFSKYNDPKKISEAYRALEKMGDAERELFARGYASTLLGKAENVKDTNSILNQMFANASPATRRKNLVAFGPERAAEFETRIRAEALMDQLRREVSTGSTTARQIAQQAASYGTASGLGAYLGYGENGVGVQTGALAGLALRYGKGQINEKVANEVAKILTSRDPNMLSRLLAMAAREPAVARVMKTLNEQAPKIAGLIAGKTGNAKERQPIDDLRKP